VNETLSIALSTAVLLSGTDMREKKWEQFPISAAPRRRDWSTLVKVFSLAMQSFDSPSGTASCARRRFADGARHYRGEFLRFFNIIAAATTGTITVMTGPCRGGTL
jgi:hypothetical protein